IATQGGTGVGDRNMDDMVAALAGPDGMRPKLVHRLDRDTTGVLVFGKTHAGTAALAESFRDRDTKKVYWAIVLGVPRPASGQIRSWMRKDYGPGQADREMMRPAIQKDEGAVHAITDYMVVQNAGQEAAWMALRPVTGRTHQLRFHLTEIGNSIAGDPKYRCDRPTPGGLDGKLLLHARAIEIPHPKKGTLRVIAPIPPHMKKAFDLLGFDERDAKDPFEPFE
ncbi:MAG: RluA family pseudouridine synthase, partial [Caulobacterales bacterium]